MVSLNETAAFAAWHTTKNVGNMIIQMTVTHQIADYAGVSYHMDPYNLCGGNNRRVNEWLVHHMDESPFHKL